VNPSDFPAVPAVERLLENLHNDGRAVDVRIGAHWTAVVVETRAGLRAGLAATQLALEGAPAERTIDLAAGLVGKRGAELAALAVSMNPLDRSLGFAAINALLEVPVSACVARNAEEMILEVCTGSRVAMVGHFPFVDRIRRAAKLCWILELDPGPDDVPASRAPELLPQADVVAVTGMTLVNGTFDTLAPLWRPDAYVLVLGPSTPLSPVLFGYGVSALSGTIVEEIPTVLEGVSRGATFRQLSGRRLVTMELARWLVVRNSAASEHEVGLRGTLS
jgi:uncharacterized protein